MLNGSELEAGSKAVAPTFEALAQGIFLSAPFSLLSSCLGGPPQHGTRLKNNVKN